MLGLIDAALVASLIVMVMISSYENFVGRFDETRQDGAVVARQARFRQPEDQGRVVDRGHLVDPPPPGVPQRSAIRQHQGHVAAPGLHLTFVVSALLLGYRRTASWRRPQAVTPASPIGIRSGRARRRGEDRSSSCAASPSMRSCSIRRWRLRRRWRAALFCAAAAGLLRPGGARWRAGRLRAVVLQLLDLCRTARDLPRGPLRRAGRAGQGVGRALLKHLARRCVSENLGRLEWAVLDWNEPAIAFYRASWSRLLKDWGDRRRRALHAGARCRCRCHHRSAFTHGVIGADSAMPWRLSTDRTLRGLPRQAVSWARTYDRRASRSHRRLNMWSAGTDCRPGTSRPRSTSTAAIAPGDG